MSATNLTGVVTATAPAGFEMSSNGTSFSTTATFMQTGGSASGTLAASTVAGEYAGTVTLESPGATTVDVAMPASTVARRAVTVTAVAARKTVGQTDPALSFTTAALVNGDTASGAFAGGLSWQSGEAAGTYAISAGTLAAANYEIAFVAADFVIHPTVQVAGANVRRMCEGSNNWSDSYLALSVFTTVAGARLGWQLPDGSSQTAATSTAP